MLAPVGCPADRDTALAVLATDDAGNPNPAAPPEILHDHANNLDDRGQHEAALRFYDAALERYRPDQVREKATCFYNRGVALRRLERWEEAVAAYEASWQLEPENIPVFVNISVPLEELGRHEEAVVWLERGAAQYPDHLGIVETLALVHIEHDDHGRARAPAERALALRKAGYDGNDGKMVAYFTTYLAEH